MPKEVSGKRKSQLRQRRAHKALLIAEQINFCREELVAFNTAYQIRKEARREVGDASTYRR